MFFEKETYHFLVLHFPIALFITGYFFNLIYIFSNDIKYFQFINWMVGMGIIWGFIAILTGVLIDWEIIFELHGILMVLCIFYFCILYYLFNKKIENKLFLFLHTIGILLLIYGTHQGVILCGLHF